MLQVEIYISQLKSELFLPFLILKCLEVQLVTSTMDSNQTNKSISHHNISQEQSQDTLHLTLHNLLVCP